MNIYLDIDGVLLINETNAAPYADEFLGAILKYFPDTTYWLTTHCWQGENRTHEVLAPHLKPDTVKLLKQIKPTEWGDAKTDAIDFSQPFLWFDDDLYPEEQKILERHNVLNRWIGIDLQKNPDQLKELVDSVNKHHNESKDRKLNPDELKEVTKLFKLLLEIDSDQKKK